MTQHVYEALAWASSFLEKYPDREEIAKLLLMHHTGWSRSRLFAEMRTELSSETLDAFNEDIQTVAGGIPVQHVIGHESFYGRDFFVNRHTLIPRPETEELIELIVTEAKSLSRPLRIVDIGTGTGCIAITLALELGAEVDAVDISTNALHVARENAAKLQADVTFFEGDLFAPVEEKTYDIIVSNPPYIPEGDRADMDVHVKDHEPANALFAGVDGLDIYRRFVQGLSTRIRAGGIVAVEIGHGQGGAVTALMQEAFGDTATVSLHNDINGRERIVMARLGK
ncbi:peptide chain release factor N(5)-glutamine methyltransferase [Paenalkalicoccus suaedae]|uniref:Release factor glutamine methyltransferase n=1 Tax=Paenalkalicoccus suaedae TaxID=2592382 RepID=A0A859FI65_9BACI|nr:peptide chain release factor N(5)-glutamine methyltransferase [Paenalkalicoccus suaedae]QKS72769.1 peptide chain release factor N(5)-glutamine methyltransferase [Paenalkalicoccus suaedae]